MNGERDSWIPWDRPGRWLLAGGVLLLLLQIVLFHRLRHDDAFITYRYGQNLASGKGLVFNPGERIMASTSPGHALLSAAVYALVGKEHLPSVMSGLGCLGWTLQAVGVFFLLRKALGAKGALYISLCVALGAAWSHRFVALETNLVAALVVWCIVAALGNRWLLTAGLCALAGLMRPDAYLLVGPLGWLCWKRNRKIIPQTMLVGALISLPWYAFAWQSFGALWPQSAPAKMGHLSFFESLGLVSHCVALNPVSPCFVLWTGSRWNAAIVFLVLGLVGWGTSLLLHRDSRLWVLPVSGGLYFLAYVLFRARDGTEWHVYPLLLLVSILLLGWFFLLTKRLLCDTKWHLLWGTVLVCIPLLITTRTLRHARTYSSSFFYGARHAVYKDIAKYLAAAAQPDDVVVLKEIGTIAYWSELPIIDLCGLATKHPYREILSLSPRPDWLVWLPPYGGGPPPVPPTYATCSCPVCKNEPGLAGVYHVEAMVVAIDDRFWSLWEPALASIVQQ